MRPWHREVLAAVVPPAEMPLEPNVQDDERITAPHLLKPELRRTVLAVAPGDRYHGEVVTADDRLQRHLDREVEVIREQRLDLIDDVAPIGFERVSRVVIAVLEKEADARVHDAVHHKLEAGIVLGPAAVAEPGAESAIVALRQDTGVEHGVFGRIWQVR